MRHTKIVCTLGPSTKDFDVLCSMLEEGMDVARLNFSHSDRESYDETLQLLEDAKQKTGKHVPLLVDTKGPEIRTGYVEGYDEDEESSISLESGSVVTLVCDEEASSESGERCTSDTIYVSYDGLPDDIDVGQKVLFDDGHITSKVVEIRGQEIDVEILNDAELMSKRGMNFPGAKIGLPTFSEEDKEDLLYGIDKDADFAALSFIRKASNVKEIRDFLDHNGGEDIKIISKIENSEGVENMLEILEHSDGLMVARGDLGVEMPYSRVPGIQADFIYSILKERKIVVTATEMLDSMELQNTPTRAEVSDVYNAVQQGTTCVMLSGETAVGKYPVEAVKAMDRIVRVAESEIDYKKRFNESDFHALGDIPSSVCYATVSTAHNVDAACIVAFTQSGNTARNVSAYKPEVPLIVVSPVKKVARQSHMLWGTTCVHEKDRDNIEELFRRAEELVKELGYADVGEHIVSVAGTKVGVTGSTNTMRVSTIE